MEAVENQGKAVTYHQCLPSNPLIDGIFITSKKKVVFDSTSKNEIGAHITLIRFNLLST